MNYCKKQMEISKVDTTKLVNLLFQAAQQNPNNNVDAYADSVANVL